MDLDGREQCFFSSLRIRKRCLQRTQRARHTPDACGGNTPQGRSEAVTWTDAHGNIWLFGGTTAVSYDINGNSGVESTFINDLWEFDPNTHEWAWMSGNGTPTGNAPEYGNYPGVYGTLGTPSANNTPGGRAGSYNLD